MFDGIEILVTNGHTTGQQHPLIKGEDYSFFYCGDISPTASHLPVNWHMAYDNSPLDILIEKKQLLERGCNEKWNYFFEHDPKVKAVKIKKTKKGFEIDEKVIL